MQTVTSIQDFKAKYGEIGWKLLIEKFVEKSLEFPGDTDLAKTIGEMVADLETALTNLK